jgi:hypothetical protein
MTDLLSFFETDDSPSPSKSLFLSLMVNDSVGNVDNVDLHCMGKWKLFVLVWFKRHF